MSQWQLVSLSSLVCDFFLLRSSGEGSLGIKRATLGHYCEELGLEIWFFLNFFKVN